MPNADSVTPTPLPPPYPACPHASEPAASLSTNLYIVHELHSLAGKDLQHHASSAQEQRKHYRHQAVAHLSNGNENKTFGFRQFP